jgi:signal transduction histidine kinase
LDWVLENNIEAMRSISIVPTILDTVCRLTGMGFAAVACVTEDRWIACEVLDTIGFGLKPGEELDVKTTICDEIRESRDCVIISDVPADPQFRDHPTPAMYGFRSYISLPIIRSDGTVFGTLCAIDPEPRDLARPEIQSTFRMFADLLAFHLDAAEKLAASEGKLANEVATGEVREQFIAVVGHDLRNPLASIEAGVTMLRKSSDPERKALILDQMHNSVRRMSALIDNILDFARGRLGGGLLLKLQTADVEPVIRQVVAELTASYPDRELALRCEPGPALVRCDVQRMGQLVSNLLGNAFTHGARDAAISVECAVRDGVFELSVSNGGEPIPAEDQVRLFHPFARGKDHWQEGLGLGLYIASEIAKAHDGNLRVTSNAERTTFTFAMPTSGAAAAA